MSAQDDLDFLDDNNANTHDLAQDYLESRKTSSVSRWLVPLLLLVGVAGAGAGVWVFYLKDMLYPPVPMANNVGGNMGLPAETTAPTANTAAVPELTPETMTETAPEDPVQNTAQINIPAKSDDMPAADMGIALATTNGATSTANTPVVPTATEAAADTAVTANTPTDDAEFAPPLPAVAPVPESTSESTSAAAAASVVSQTPENTRGNIPEDAVDKKMVADKTTAPTVIEETIAPAMPAPTATPVTDIQPLPKNQIDNQAEKSTEITSEKPIDTAPAPTAAAPNNTPDNAQAEILLLRDQMRALTEAVEKVKATSTIQAANTDTQAYASKEAVDSIAKQLADLTAKLDTINQRTESLMTASQNIERQNMDEQSSQTPTPAPVPEVPVAKLPAKPKPVVATKPKPKPVFKPKIVAKPPAPKWQLRSASPGVAGLARGNGDIQTFVVGDIVPNLGRVTAVQQNASGLWVVVTTGGTIGQ